MSEYMPRTVVLGTIGSDAHVVGITILEQALSAAGFSVVNLGVQTSQAEFVEAVAEHGADALLVSSLYGHAERDCAGLHDRLSAAGLDPVTYVGGNLSVGQDEGDAQERFEQMGFDKVFGTETDPETAIQSLERDIRVSQPTRDRVEA
jgi:methylaspartate mutase sigma subunit